MTARQTEATRLACLKQPTWVDRDRTNRALLLRMRGKSFKEIGADIHVPTKQAREIVLRGLATILD